MAPTPPSSCATVTPRFNAKGKFSLRPTACVALRPRCLLVPVHPPHYPLLERLLLGVRRYASDLVPTVVVFSGGDEAISQQSSSRLPRRSSCRWRPPTPSPWSASSRCC